MFILAIRMQRSNNDFILIHLILYPLHKAQVKWLNALNKKSATDNAGRKSKTEFFVR